MAIEIKDLSLVNVHFTEERMPADGYEFRSGGEAELYKRASQQIFEYFQGKRKVFSLPYQLNGTEFQKMVWSELSQVQYGETISYSELAERCGKKSAVRAVANAVGRNTLLLLIPCHRIIRKSGELGGFAEGVERKRELLRGEGIILNAKDAKGQRTQRRGWRN